MRLFQNSGLYRNYLPRFNQLARGAVTFEQRKAIFLNDRFGASHFLKPVLAGNRDAFFTNADDVTLQHLWAEQHGLSKSSTPEQILLAQIEEHKADVFYNMDPMRFQSNFVRRLPGCVRKSVAWRAAPSPGADFSAYSLVVCNFPSILKSWSALGWHTAYLSPAHDPEMDSYAHNSERPIDVLFVGGYTRHHLRRAALLESVANLSDRYSVALHLDTSRATAAAESWLGRLLPLKKYRRPPVVRRVCRTPVFGRELYTALSRAKIVLNGAIDMAVTERGNMRCWEAFGTGCVLVSDAGAYPAHMVDGQTMATYESPEGAPARIAQLLSDPSELTRLAHAGTEMIGRCYSKEGQWQDFIGLVS
jgi:hypothetical protein